jgi:hypothetical protein
MKNQLLILLALLIFISCKKEPISAKKQVLTTRVVSKPIQILKTDTIYFSYKSDSKDDYAIINLLEEKYTKDSLCTSKFRIDFIQKKSKIFSDLVTIKGVEKESNWFGMYEMDTIYSPFRSLSFGYPACGYTQDNFLYYIENKESAKIHTWLSVFDGGWFNDVEFFPISKTKFACRTASFWSDDSEQENNETDEEFGILEHSDSIVFDFQNGKWQKSFKTPKEKVYRKKRVAFETMIQ